MHFEIPADNIERAKKFYQNIFGWELEETPAIDKNFFSAEKEVNGSVFKRNMEGEFPILIIGVKELDKCLERIKSMGLTVVTPKQKIGNRGYYARFLDTEGNLLGLWQSV